MLNFVYDNKTTLIFGKGTHHETGTLLKPLGKKFCFITVAAASDVPVFTMPSRRP